jgi:uncharacterized protein
MADPVTWFELHGSDPEKGAAFYEQLFGWSMESMPEEHYVLIDTHSGAGTNGGIGRANEGQAPYSVFYVENPDIQAVLDKAESLGATTVVPVAVAMKVTFAQFRDPFGSLIGLAQGDGSTHLSGGTNPPVDWFELASPEPRKAWDFYTELFGWEISRGEGEGFVHGGDDTGGGVRGGIGSSMDGEPHVVMYAPVNDLQSYLDRVEPLGGTVVMSPTKVDEHTSIAMFIDPQGVPFGIYASQP